MLQLRNEIQMLGSKYLESNLYKTWPIFSEQTCVICGEKFKREWLWKFSPKRRHQLEQSVTKYACLKCTSDRYNEAVLTIDKYYQELAFSRLRRGPYRY